MKKYFGFGLVVLVIVAGVAVYGLRKGSPTENVAPVSPIENTSPTGTKTYTNNSLNYSVKYPASWIVEEVAPDALNNDVRIRPTNPEMFYGMPADYVHIRLEDSSLAVARKIAASKVGGNDMTESTTTFAGQTAYFYSHKDYPISPDETTPSIIFRGILLEHNGQVISVYTHKYQLEEVKQILNSFRFLK